MGSKAQPGRRRSYGGGRRGSPWVASSRQVMVGKCVLPLLRFPELEELPLTFFGSRGLLVTKSLSFSLKCLYFAFFMEGSSRLTGFFVYLAL